MTTLSTTMPAQLFLTEQLGREFLLQDAAGNSINVLLETVSAGVAMDETYTCYNAVFVCPANVQALQATYSLTLDDQRWDIFMSPMRAETNGQVRLQAVFHYSIPTPSALPA